MSISASASADTEFTGKRLPRLTALRFIAAAAVFAFHANVFLEGTARQVGEALVGQGRSGVTFFFVLSGFILAWVARNGDSAAQFYRRRFARVYPVYFASLAFAGLALLLTAPGELARGVFAPFLLQSWVPDSGYYFGLNVPAWSLSVEAFFYLSFPLLWATISRLSDRKLWVVAVGSVLASVGIATLLWAGSPASLSDNSLPIWAALYFPIARLPEFLLGVVAGILLRRGALPRVRWWAAVAVVTLALIAAGVWTNAYSVVAMVLVPFAILVVAAAQRDLAGTPGWLASSWMVRLGTISYAFYLFHHIFVKRLAQQGFVALGVKGLGAWLLSLALALVAAALAYRFIEVPLERRIAGRVSSARGPRTLESAN